MKVRNYRNHHQLFYLHTSHNGVAILVPAIENMHKSLGGTGIEVCGRRGMVDVGVSNVSGMVVEIEMNCA